MARTKIWILGAVGAAAIGLGVAAGIIVPQLAQHSREQTYVRVIRSDPDATVAKLPDWQLIHGMKSECKMISDGMTSDDAIAAADREFYSGIDVGNISRFDYLENARILYAAAKAAC